MDTHSVAYVEQLNKSFTRTPNNQWMCADLAPDTWPENSSGVGPVATLIHRVPDMIKWYSFEISINGAIDRGETKRIIEWNKIFIYADAHSIHTQTHTRTWSIIITSMPDNSYRWAQVQWILWFVFFFFVHGKHGKSIRRTVHWGEM